MKTTRLLTTVSAIAALLTFGTATTLTAQQTPVTSANYNLAERYSASRMAKLVKSKKVAPNWFRDSDKFWYEWKDTEGTRWYIVDATKGTKKEVFDRERLAQELTEMTHDAYDAQHIPVKNLKLKDDKRFAFEIQSNLMVPKKEIRDSLPADSLKFVKTKDMEKKLFRLEYDIATGILTDVSDREEEKEIPEWAGISPDTSTVIYVKGFDVYLTDMANLRKLMKDEKDSTVTERRLTCDGTEEKPYGCDYYKGASDRDSSKRYPLNGQWSPDSKTFASLEYDLSSVEPLWVINSISEPRPTLEQYSYVMPAEKSEVESLHIFSIPDSTHRIINHISFKGQNSYISTKPLKHSDIYDKYGRTEWLGDRTSFWLTTVSRGEHHAQICLVDLEHDTVKVVLQEDFNTYIDAFDFRMVNDGRDFILLSEKSGWSHLYLYDRNGNLKNAITKGSWHIDRILGTDDKTQTVYFEGCGYDKGQNPYYMHAFSAKYDGSGLKELDEGDFYFTHSLSDDCKYLVTHCSRVDTAPSSALRSTSGKKIMELETADFRELFKSGYRFPQTFTVKAADGVTDLYGVMYKPFDFDSTKCYPIIEYVYPGPQVESTEYEWRAMQIRTDRLAQLGFIVITVGQRGGHPARSRWYHNFGYGNMRDYPLADHKYAVQQLAARYKWIDIDRVGIHGHSGGGFMSTAAILTYPDFYKAAVSCAGNHDNRIYNRWWSETHHGVKEVISENDTTFEYAIKTNQELAKNLKGHLLLVHGDIDDNVHPANTMRVVNALIRANKRFDMLILPGQRHGFGDMNDYFFWKMADFFSLHLLGDCHDTVDIPEMNND